jgi:hypothetical protein
MRMEGNVAQIDIQIQKIIIYLSTLIREDQAKTKIDERDLLKGPPVVHCNVGGARYECIAVDQTHYNHLKFFFRSGSYVAIDENLCMAESRGLVDIFGVVKHLVKQRKSLFASAEQLG